MAFLPVTLPRPVTPSRSVLLALALAGAVDCGGSVRPAALADAGEHPEAGERDAAAPAPDAGDPDGPAGCRKTTECTLMIGAYCAGPYDGPCMGGCAPPMACTTDAQCEAGTVCRSVRAAACGTTSPICFEGCQSDDDCPPTDTCVTSGHCQPRTCAECPAYFSCAHETCAVPPCQNDGECSGGYCVNGSCAGALGTCMGGCG